VALRNIGWDGAISRAAGAVALAALDAAARERREPVWRLLGAAEPPAPEAVAVLGYTPVGADAGDAELAEALAAAEAGVRCVKLMGGFGGPEADIARVTRLQAALGDGCLVGLDVNGGWSRDEAQAALPRLARPGVAFVEEPWPFELGLAGFEGLPADRPALAVGEICASVIELQAMAATGEVALVRADATLLGGAEPWLAAVRGAEAAGARAFPHFWAEVHRHLMAGCEQPGYVETTMPGGGAFGLDGLVHGLAVPEDGRIAAPSTPGFGYALDWEAIVAAAGPPQVARIDAEGG
jgi:L-alanine-DL-glutamate epimerase-like enolase superfamily enzyme